MYGLDREIGGWGGLCLTMRVITRTLLLAMLTVLGLAAAAPPAVAAPVQTIASARHLPVGSAVTVAGTVTTPSGAFSSSFSDNGFGLQDPTAGIYVSTPEDLKVRPGRKARVTGTLRDSSGLLVLVPTAVELGNTVGPVIARPVATSAVGESTEGLLVRVAGRITQAPVRDLPYGYKFWIDDGSGDVQIFVNVQTSIEVAAFRLGQVVLVTGFSGQFGSHYEVLPRSPRDVCVLYG